MWIASAARPRLDRSWFSAEQHVHTEQQRENGLIRERDEWIHGRRKLVYCPRIVALCELRIELLDLHTVPEGASWVLAALCELAWAHWVARTLDRVS